MQTDVILPLLRSNFIQLIILGGRAYSPFAVEEFGVKVIEEEILKSAFKLIENGIIGRDDKAYSGHKVKIENSLLRNTIEESIKAEPSYIMFSYWMYNVKDCGKQTIGFFHKNFYHGKTKVRL